MAYTTMRLLPYYNLTGSHARLRRQPAAASPSASSLPARSSLPSRVRPAAALPPPAPEAHNARHQQQHKLQHHDDSGGAPSPLREAARRVATLAAALSLALAGTAAAPPPPSHALLNSPNAQIPRTVDAALRRSIPAFNEDVAKVQSALEDVAYLLRIPQRKPWGSMTADLAVCAAPLSTPEGRASESPS